MKKKVFYGILERIYGFFKKILRILLITGAFFAGMQLGRFFYKKRAPVLPGVKDDGACKPCDSFDEIKAQIDELDRELEERLKEQPSEELLEKSVDFSEDTSDVINNWDNMFDIPADDKNIQPAELLCEIPRLIKQDAKLEEAVRKKQEVQVAGCILCYLKGIPFDGTMDRKELVERLGCTYTLFDRTEKTVRYYISRYCASLAPLSWDEIKKISGLSADFVFIKLDKKQRNGIIEKEDNPELYKEMEFGMKRMKERYLLYNNIYRENKQ